MAVVAKIKCPPDQSIRCFRLVDPMSFGIVKGADTEVAIPTKGICIPVANYEDRRLLLRANSILKLDVSGIAVYGDLLETYEFVVNLNETPGIISPGTKHSYSLYDSSLNLIETIEFTVDVNFATSVVAAFSNSSSINTLVSIDPGNISTGSFTIAAQTKGVKYRHVFSFDLDGFGGANPHPFVHPGNLTQKFRKYPEGRVKIILAIPEFGKVDTSTCGCTDNTGVISSDKKYFQYAFASDYEKTLNPSTPILVSGANDGTSYAWSQSSTDHIGYHFNSGDLTNMQTAPTSRALVQSIDGYSITTDAGLGNNTQANLQHVWSPSTTNWRTAGEMSLFTGGQDVSDTDNLFIETLYLKNPQAFDIPMRILVGS
jgi:hypothetical protein